MRRGDRAPWKWCVYSWDMIPSPGGVVPRKGNLLHSDYRMGGLQHIAAARRVTQSRHRDIPDENLICPYVLWNVTIPPCRARSFIPRLGASFAASDADFL